MCQSMVNIQSQTAEIRRGKKRRKKKERNSMKILWSALLHRATIMNKRGVPLCRKSWLKLFAIVIEIGKPCSTMQKILIEICMEQTQLFQCNQFHCADFFRTNSAHSEKFWLKSTKISSIERTQLFLCNRFHCAENWQSPSRFLGGKWVELMNIYVARMLCMT